MIVHTTRKPLAFGMGIVNACPTCFGDLCVHAHGEAQGLSVCEHCGEAFAHQPHPDGRICARMPRAWFVANVGEATRAELRRVQERIWHDLGQFG